MALRCSRRVPREPKMGQNKPRLLPRIYINSPKRRENGFKMIQLGYKMFPDVPKISIFFRMGRHPKAIRPLGAISGP